MADVIAPLRATLGLVALGCWYGAAALVARRLHRPLATLAGSVRALREGDYTIRARVIGSAADVVREALQASNELAALLDRHRLEVVDATTLTQRLMDEVEVAVIGLDDDGRVQLCNVAGGRLLGGAPTPGATAGSLGIASWLTGPSPRIVEPRAGLHHRWQLRRAQFRQAGRPFTLLVLTDLSRVLHAEARQAAFNVVRVLSHEVNNTLTPIQSTAEALASRIDTAASPADSRLKRSLQMIAERSEGLGRFLAAYTELAQLPPPRPSVVDVGAWVRRATSLETRLPVGVAPGPDVQIWADASQLDQVLINLVRNATDACHETGGDVTVSWNHDHGEVIVRVVDGGPGLVDRANLFVPLYTTKVGGSGIGLALGREIIRAHGGELTLDNREDATGSVATIRLPGGRGGAGGQADGG